jgi:hypothetical protein
MERGFPLSRQASQPEQLPVPPPPSNTRPHQPPHDLQPHGGSLHDPNPNTLATTSSERNGEPLQRRVIG